MFNEPNRNKQGKKKLKEVCRPLSSKLFVIYCFNGKTINIDSNAKVCKNLANLANNEENKEKKIVQISIWISLKLTLNQNINLCLK